MTILLAQAGPFPFFTAIHKVCTDGISFNIASYDPKNLVRFDPMGSVATLINCPLPDRIVVQSPADGVGSSEPLHSPNKCFSIPSTCQQMPMVGHQAKGIDFQGVLFQSLQKSLDPAEVIRPCLKKQPAFRSAITDMIDPAIRNVSRLPWHKELDFDFRKKMRSFFILGSEVTETILQQDFIRPVLRRWGQRSKSGRKAVENGEREEEKP